MNDKKMDWYFSFSVKIKKIQNIENDTHHFADIDEDDNDLQKIKVDNDLDTEQSYAARLTNLSPDTTYYYAIGVSYKDNDGDDLLIVNSVKSFKTEEGDEDDEDEIPDADTGKTNNITGDSAATYGTIDMNNYENDVVFFLYGDEREELEDVEDEYTTYEEIEEQGDSLQKEKVYRNFDSSGTFVCEIEDLDKDTTYYYTIGVEFKNEDNENTLLFGSIKSFTTDK